jgi:Arc/MetJ family transcription regulator
MRTNIVLDDSLLKKAKAILGTRTKKETVEAAMAAVVRQHEQQKLLELRGIGWEGNLAEIRRDKIGD